MKKLFNIFGICCTLILLQGCGESTNETLTLGEIWSWLSSGFELFNTGNWKLITVGQAVAIIIIITIIGGLILALFDWIRDELF
jgi:hypothetical protein